MNGSGTKLWNLLKKGKVPGQNKWILLLLAGVLLLVLALPVSGPKEQETEGTKKETEVEEDYASQAEEKLERILTQMEGAGKVKVMITLSSSSEKVVEKDEETSQDESQNSTSETTVYEETADRGQTPYVAKELTPAVGGVVVLCEGGDEPVVVQQITEAVEALFPVESHKIKVVKMK